MTDEHREPDRGKFEAWAHAHSRNDDPDINRWLETWTNADGTYHDYGMQLAWEAWQASAAAMREESGVLQDDLAAILRAVGLSDSARPYSPHEVVRRDLLPRLAAMREDAERYRWLRLRAFKYAYEDGKHWWVVPYGLITYSNNLGEAIDTARRALGDK